MHTRTHEHTLSSRTSEASELRGKRVRHNPGGLTVICRPSYLPQQEEIQRGQWMNVTLSAEKSTGHQKGTPKLISLLPFFIQINTSNCLCGNKVKAPLGLAGGTKRFELLKLN